eukprot:1592091-Pleurochrysis_carterae.AAC.1
MRENSNVCRGRVGKAREGIGGKTRGEGRGATATGSHSDPARAREALRRMHRVVLRRLQTTRRLASVQLPRNLASDHLHRSLQNATYGS